MDIRADSVSALYFRLGADRRITVEKFEEKIELEEFLNSPLRRAANASWEGKQFWNHRRRMLAVAGADRATTIPVPLAWKREAMRAQTPLMLDEIDDHIGRALPKIITACRTEVAVRFDVDPIDVVLVAMRATNVAVDGHHAANVAGFIGSEISLVLDLTFARRDLFDHLNQLFKSPDGFFFMEAPQAELQALSLVRPLPLNLILPNTDSAMTSSLFVLEKAKEKYAVMYREKFLWSFEPIIGAIRTEFSVSRDAAGEMYAVFTHGEVSADVARAFGAIVRPHIESLETALRKSNVRGTTLIPGQFSLPYEFPHHAGKAVIEHLARVLSELFEKFDLSVDVGPLAGRDDILFHHLVPFLLMYFDRAHGALDDRLRRKVHWLVH